MTTWTRVHWRARPGQCALVVMLATLVSTAGAHLLAGAQLPQTPGLVACALSLAALGLVAYRFPGGAGRLAMVLLVGQGAGHSSLSLDSSSVVPSLAGRRVASARLSAAPCALHDFTALTFPSTSSSSGPSLMLVAHILAVGVAALLVLVIYQLVGCVRRWFAALRRRLDNRRVHTVRFVMPAHDEGPPLHRLGRGPPAQRGPPCAV